MAEKKEDRSALNRELAQMFKGGVIMDVTTPEQAKIAEDAGACAVMALERIPADIRAAGGVSRMSDPAMIHGIQKAVSIPVMAKCRIGHFVEAQLLEAIEIDYIDESEVLSPADDVYHIDKTKFRVPFVCGARDIGEALRRIAEGASMIRTKGEPGTGDIIQAVQLGSAERMLAFCRGIQAAAPVDSYVTPVPWAMPGYDSEVVMAAGAFVQGSSIELSAYGPIREPFAVYFQGGLTWYHAKLGILMSLQKLVDAGLVTLP